MTPTPQQIRSETYKLDRVAENAAPWGMFADDVATIKAISAKWNKRANSPSVPSTHKITFGWVAHDTPEQLACVAQIGGKRVRLSGWPSGASEAFKNAVKTDLIVLPRVQREQQGSKPGLEPLLTDAAIQAERAKHAKDISFYSANNIGRIEFGNEWDLTRYWNAPIDQVAATYGVHILPLYFDAGIDITLALPLNPNNVAPFLLNFKATDTLRFVKRLSMHPYQGTGAAHIQRAKDILAEAQTVIPSMTLDQIDVSEFGLQRGGNDDDFMREIKIAFDWYVSMKYLGELDGYRISVTERPESKRAPFKDGQPTATLPKWKAIAA